MLNGIQNLVDKANFKNITNFGYDEPTSADVTWRIGDALGSTTSSKMHLYSYVNDLDRDDTPFGGMDVLKLLTQRQLDMLKAQGKFPGIVYSSKSLRDGYT